MLVHVPIVRMHHNQVVHFIKFEIILFHFSQVIHRDFFLLQRICICRSYFCEEAGDLGFFICCELQAGIDRATTTSCCCRPSSNSASFVWRCFTSLPIGPFLVGKASKGFLILREKRGTDSCKVFLPIQVITQLSAHHKTSRRFRFGIYCVVAIVVPIWLLRSDMHVLEILAELATGFLIGAHDKSCTI